MKLQHYPSELLKNQISAILKNQLGNLSPYQAFFFGSRVTRHGDDRSDIDLGIQAAGPIPSQTMSRITEDIDQLPTLYKIDVVDFSSVSGQFAQVAKQSVEYI